ncbi:MAG: hypothetical protein ACHQ1H_03665 [Nitrososphaerales archaeon]
MSKSNVISISKSPLFRVHKTPSIPSSNPNSIFNVLREIGVNPGIISQLEIYDHAGGERTVEMFENIFGDFLACVAEVNLEALVKKHGGDFTALYDKFRAVNV